MRVIPIPTDLYFLIEEILDTYDFGQNEARQPRLYFLAVLYVARHPDDSVRAVAKALSVAPSTVSRWMKEDLFSSLVDDFRANPQHLQKAERQHLQDLPYEIDEL